MTPNKQLLAHKNCQTTEYKFICSKQDSAALVNLKPRRVVVGA